MYYGLEGQGANTRGEAKFLGYYDGGTKTY